MFEVALALILLLIAVAVFAPRLLIWEFGMQYPALHAAVELVTVVIALGISGYLLLHQKTLGTSRLVFWSWILIATTVLDVFHILSYPGMPNLVIFPTTNTAIYFWLAGRFLTVLGFLAGLFFPDKRAGRGHVLVPLVLLGIVLGVWFYVGEFQAQLPHLVTIFGLTQTKVELEYALIVLLALTAGLYRREGRRVYGQVPYYLILFFVTMMASEFYFTLYHTPYSLFNFFGHLLHLAAYVFLAIAFRNRLRVFAADGRTFLAKKEAGGPPPLSL